MNRLFNTLRRIVEKPSQPGPALSGFDSRVEVLYKYAQRAAEYEDDLDAHFEQVRFNLDRIQARIETALDDGRDRDAFEFVRLAARLRPQYDLLDRELRIFRAVANELIARVGRLMDHLEEARAFALDGASNPAATRTLDEALTRLTRYFVMLERVATARRKKLPALLAQKMTQIIDDRQLDLELARYVLNRRKALGPGRKHEGE